MPKRAKNLSPREIKKLVSTKTGLHAVGHITGLCIFINKYHQAKWKYRYTINGETKLLTIGDYDGMDLNTAKKHAAEWQAVRMKGFDPMEVKRENEAKTKARLQKERQDRVAEKPKHKFCDVADECIKYLAVNGNFVNNRRGEQTMRNYLEQNAYARLKYSDIAKIAPADIKKVLDPVYQDKPALCAKLIRYLKQVFDYALSQHYRSDPNPVDMKGPLGVLLKPMKNGVKQSQHYPCLDYHEMPEFFKELWERRDTIGSQAFMVAILTASRSQPIRNMKRDQVDLKDGIWTIPPEFNKVKKHDAENVVLLNPQAVYLLNMVEHSDSLFFPSKNFKPLSDAVFGKIIDLVNENRKELGLPKFVDKNILDPDGKPCRITQHGTSRATFRNWTNSDELGNNRKFDSQAAEFCLLHGSKDPLKGAYNREKLMKERRLIMDEWGKYCCKLIPELADL